MPGISMRGVAPMPLTDEFPVAFQTFAAKIKGTADEVWTHMMNNMFGHMKMTEVQWMAKLESLKG